MGVSLTVTASVVRGQARNVSAIELPGNIPSCHGSMSVSWLVCASLYNPLSIHIIKSSPSQHRILFMVIMNVAYASFAEIP